MCPAGWGKMPKWRPATTLDSPTAGRRRRRLRPSIGNGSPPSPFSLPPRLAVGLPPTLLPAAASAPAPAAPPRARAPRQARSGPAPSPHPPFPALSYSAGYGRHQGAVPRGAEMGEGMTTEGWGRGEPLGPSTATEVKWPPAALERSRAARSRPLVFPVPASTLSAPTSYLPLAPGMERVSEGDLAPSAESQAQRPLRDAPGAQIITCLCRYLGPGSPDSPPAPKINCQFASVTASIPFPLVFLLGEMLICQPPVNCLAVRLEKMCEVPSADDALP